MFHNVYKLHKRVIAAVLCLIVVATTVLPGFGNVVLVHAATDALVDGTTVTSPEASTSYYFDFLNNDALKSAVAGEYGLVTISDGVTANGHGPAFGNGKSISLKVRGNSKISIGYCAYNSEGAAFTVETDGTGSVSDLPSFPAKKTFNCYDQSGKMYFFKYFNEDNDVHTITIQFKATCYVPYLLVEPVEDTSVTGIPESNQTYTYNFGNPAEYNNGDPIGMLVSKDELLTINGNNKMKTNGDKHGLIISEGQSFEIKVAGNAYITFGGCQYGKDAALEVTGGLENGKTTASSVSVKTATDGEEATIGYAGEATTLVFTVKGSGYLHSITVKNTTEPIDVKQWSKKDFSIKVGDTLVEVAGAASEEEASAVTLSNGTLYTQTSDSAYISIPLSGKKLRNVAIENLSTDIVESVQVNDEGNLVVTYKDQETNPSTYTMMVQDSSLFVEPFVTDVTTYNFGSGIVPKVFTASAPIGESYTIDTGLLTLGKGEGTKGIYFHDASHGLAIYNGNYIDVKVAGDALINFSLCQYGAGGTIATASLPEGATGSFDSDTFKGAACNDTITYSYTGKAGTIRFVLTNTGEAYLHGMTVKNTGKVAASEVANKQEEMPALEDASNTLSVTPNGHRIYASHTNSKATMASLDQLGYYLFDQTSSACTLSADIKVNSIKTSGNSGVFVGMFDVDTPVSKIATIGIRGDKKVRNVYSKPTQSDPGAGGINTTFTTDDTMHIEVRKDADGFYTAITIGGVTSTNLLKYSNCPLFTDGQDTKVRYGFGFSNVDAVITNLLYQDEAGNVLYDQNSCYDAIGTAPAVDEIDSVDLNSDRTKITVNWSGEACTYDGCYKVELSKDNGATYQTLSEQVCDKSYTADVDGDGTYKFRVRGICGKQETSPVESKGVVVVAPLESPVLKTESKAQAITLKWNAVKDAVSYEVYRKSSEETSFTKIATTDQTTYTDGSLENETPFYYYVVAKSLDNTSNPSNTSLSVPSAGHTGVYVYGDEACEINITKKSYDTVYKKDAVLAGVVSKKGTLSLTVNGTEQKSLSLKAKESFSFAPELEQGRNDVTLYFTDTNNKVTRKTFNFVYLTNYDMIVDSNYTGEDGASIEGNDQITQYKTVQAAVNAVAADNKEQKTILVKAGTYREHLVIRSPYINLIGEDRELVNINYFDANESPVGGDTSTRCATYVTSTATGFSAENVTFENTYEYLGNGTISNESADALRVDADQSTFVNVKLLGYQDTLDASVNHQYYYKCYISGNVDYIYGSAQALFEDCDLVYRYNGTKNAGYVTAPKTSAQASYGYIFNNCRVYAEEGCSGSKYLLARPWGPDGAATFINCYMSSIVNASNPYADMSGNLAVNARFNEYYTYGEGFAINNNRPQISKKQADAMLSTSALGWNPQEAILNAQYKGNVTTNSNNNVIETEYVDDTFDPETTKDTGLGVYNINGYASVQNVSGGGNLLETSKNYHKVKNADEFLAAVSNAKTTGKKTVIELTADINLGSKEIGDAINTYSNIIKPHSMQALLHPTLIKSGVSILSLSEMSNLTIFSQNGASIKHVCTDITNSKNIIIRNIIFDELWEWDEGYKNEYEAGEYDRNDWDYITVENESTGIWIDHCTFYRSYDGIVDVKKAGESTTTDVTISWSKFLPGSEGSFFDDMMAVLESNQSAYTYYNHLLTDLEMTKEQVRYYAASQKKTHLVGASDTEPNYENLRITLANNYYKNCCDRMPRLRGGYGHVYNCVIDSEELYQVKQSIKNSEAASKIASIGSLSTCDASVLVENTTYKGVLNPLLSGNMNSPAGSIAAINSLWYLNGVKQQLVPKGNPSIANAQPLILDAASFKEALPYGDVDYLDASQLEAKIVERTGAGTLEMTPSQWEKTTYNDDTKVADLSDTTKEEPSAPQEPSKPTTPSTQPSKPTTTTKPNTNVTVNPVTKLKATKATTKTITVSWTGVSGASGYEVIYKNASGKTVTKAVSAKTRSYTVAGLRPNTTYKVSVRAYKTVNKSKVYSKTSTISYKTKQLSKPSKTSAKTTSTSIKLSWSKVSEANGYLVTYKNALGKTVKVYTKNMSLTVAKLPANKSITFKVQAYTIVNGKKVYGNYVKRTVKTSKTAKPNKVTVKKASATSKRSIKVTYGKTKNAAGYEVSYSLKKSSGYKIVDTKTSLSKTIKNLKSKKTYYVRVRAYNYEYKVVKGKLCKKKVYGSYSTRKVVKVK